MHETSRRKLIKTTAAGTGVALGAGGAGAAAAETVEQASNDVQREFTATPSDGFVVLDGDDAQGSGSLLGRLNFAGQGINTGAEIQGEVYGDATWSSTGVTLPELTDLILAIGPDSIIKNIDIPTLLNNVKLDAVLNNLVTILKQLDIDPGDDPEGENTPDQTQLDAIKTIVGALAPQLNIGISASLLKQFIGGLLTNPSVSGFEQLLGFLVNLDNVTTIADLLSELSANPDIPINLTPQGVEDLLLNLDFAGLLSSISIEVSPPQISGTFDPGAGTVTAPIQDPTVTVTYNGQQLISETLPFSVTLTSETSGSLTGSVSGLGSGSDSGSVTLVDNEFTLGLGEIETLIDSIDIETLVLNLLQNSSIGSQLPDTDLSKVVQDIDPNALVENLDIPQIIGFVLTDTSGRHYLQLSLDIAFGTSGSDPVPERPEFVPGNPIRDTDGDGLFENIRGDGDPGLADVQTLFEELDTPEVQENANKFNFSGVGDDVSVLDVQALFNDLT